MTNFRSDYATGKRNTPQPDTGEIRRVPVEFTLPTAALVLNDTIELTTLQPGVQLVDYDIISGQLDSNGTATLDFSIGALNAAKTDLAAVYGSGLEAGQGANGAIVRATDARAYLADASGERAIALKVTTVAATWAGGGKKLLVNLHLKA